jgi:uncharacterized protein (TIGR02597 family)
MNPSLKKIIFLFLAPICLMAQDVITEPVGFNKVTCLSNSDTIVGVPLRKEGSFSLALTATPSVNGDSATLTFAPGSLTAGALNGHFVKFVDGDRTGRWYDIQAAPLGTANTASAVTIRLNGDTLGGATTGNRVLIARYWTLDTLFPPSGATTGWTETPVGSGIRIPNGHAIVASSTASLTERKTELIFPDATGTGTNRLATDLFYITGGLWRKPGVSGSQGNRIVLPDSLFTIRHLSSVNYATVFRSLGEVEVNEFDIPLATNVVGKRDTYVAIPRPVNVRLDQMNLVESGAFVTSPSASLTQRKDELLVYDNSVTQLNKIPSVAYYHTGGNWRKSGTSTSQNDQIIPAGAGFVIRKFQTANGFTFIWDNTPSFPTP